MRWKIMITLSVFLVVIMFYTRYRVTIDKYTFTRPKIIYRTTARAKMSYDQLTDTHLEWLRLNPDYTMIWYDNDMCSRFMADNYPGRVNDAYLKLKPMAYRADLWRLCVLNLYGGVYIDAYAKPYVSLSQMFKGCEDIFVSILDPPSSRSGIHNGFIASNPDHPFLKRGIEDIVKNVEYNYYGDSCLAVTGPLCLRKSIVNIARKKPEQGFNKTNPSYFLYYLSPGGNQDIYKGREKIFCKYFSVNFYKQWKSTKTRSYAHMWKNRDIYY